FARQRLAARSASLRLPASLGTALARPSYNPSMDAIELLTTTRSVRKRLDLARPVPRALIEECIEIALQAPTGSNAQGWHFVVVTDAAKRAEIARYYREALQGYIATQESAGPRWKTPGDPRAVQETRVRESAIHLAEHLHEVPVHVIPCIE